MPVRAATVVPLNGDLVRTRARKLFRDLRGVARRREDVVLDFAQAGRIDSTGVALVSLLQKAQRKAGRSLELAHLAPHHQAALGLMPTEDVPAVRPTEEPAPGVLERIGGRTLAATDGVRSLWGLVSETCSHAIAVLTRTKRLPAGALPHQVATMGVDAIFIVGLLSFLLGMTMAFQGAVQLQRFGAGVFVADMIGLTMVREIAPLMTAVILTGRTGAAIAAELGTMQVRSEIDALSTMGIEPVRFLILPRIAAITFVGPALSLLGMFIGMAGGMLVARFTLDMTALDFWGRMVDRLALGDFLHGLGKSLVFAWIIGFTGSHLGLRAKGDAGSVGSATTRTVVAAIFCIIVVDAIFATVTLMWRHQ